MSGDIEVKPWHTHDDVEWMEREAEGIVPNPTPLCEAYCQGCGGFIRRESSAPALCKRCYQVLSSVPLILEKFMHEAGIGKRNICGYHLVDPTQSAGHGEDIPDDDNS